jgi:N-acetylmuramic acid 6-phosphate etherase
METLAILRLINSQDKMVPHAVEAELPYIALAVELIVESLRNGGRLIYVGAGTSGRLGVLDAAECPPTFGTKPFQVIGMIAGGSKALKRSIEGAEDDRRKGVRDMDNIKPDRNDVVCGIAASRRTPYVVAAVRRARQRGAKTIYLTTNSRESFDLKVDVAICPDVGPEVIMGSTRMKSGTAQKLVLNMLTTAAMIRLGKVYENMMVDLQMKSRKLVERARRIVMIATGADYATASRVLSRANGQVKTALVMILGDTSPVQARKQLSRANGFVRRALEAGNPRQ